MAHVLTETERTQPAPVNELANPAPLGLCGFALTTFVLSCHNAGLFGSPTIVIGLALFYGGLAQLLAGMWEFRTGNTFGSTAFSSYGAFWMAVGVSLQFKLIAPDHGFAFFLLGWTVFTAMMLVAALRSNLALIALFACLLLTFICLTIGAFGGGTTVIGGYLGIVTALIAWYAALAALLTATKSIFQLPVGPMQ